MDVKLKIGGAFDKRMARLGDEDGRVHENG